MHRLPNYRSVDEKQSDLITGERYLLMTFRSNEWDSILYEIIDVRLKEQIMTAGMAVLLPLISYLIPRCSTSHECSIQRSELPDSSKYEKNKNSCFTSG